MSALVAAALTALVSLSAAVAKESEPAGRSAHPPAGVELHAHLFMKEGMGWFFTGDFFGELRARDWRDRFSSQTNPAAMGDSGLRVCVATLYAHPAFTLSLRDSIRRQVGMARRFVAENPSWALAKTPAEARAALADGRSVLVLGLEGASGIIENEDDVHEFVDTDGIRIITFLHLTDDLFGGVAFLKGIQILADPWAAVKSLFAPAYDADGVRVNPLGLTEAGREMAITLIKHHVWLDLSHASDASTRELLPLLKAAGQPVLYTHTVLRRLFRAERGIDANALQAVRDSNGMVGLMPSEDMLAGTSEDGGLPALVAQAAEVGRVIGDDGVALGSDWNGGVRHLHPASGTGTSLDRQAGYWNIGQSREAWLAMKRDPNRVVERFLKGWEKVFR